jgi:peptidoglycan hydrolase-like protein with peptidoglycan-binding domain
MSCRLRTSVGPSMPNLPEDVGTVQFLLQMVGGAAGGSPALVLDGQWSPAADTAVRAFQQRHFAFDDGIVNPGDITMLRLQVLYNDTGLGFGVARNAVLSNIGSGVDTILSTRQGADGIGEVSLGATRNIYAHPLHGTWEVHGDLLNAYQANLEEGGALGYPISGVRQTSAGTLMVKFERGRIDQDPGQLAVATIFQ